MRDTLSNLTYDEIIAGVDYRERKVKSDAKLWEFYRKEALALKPQAYSKRMAFAEIALRAVRVVKRGKRAKENDAITIAKFTEGMRTDRRTLTDWIKAKVKVFDHLPEDDKAFFSVTCAIAAVEKMNRIKERPVQADYLTQYKKFASGEEKHRDRRLITEHLSAVRGRLKRKSSVILEDELREAKEMVMEILELISERLIVPTMKKAARHGK